jgi:urease accessory protein
LDLGNIPLRLRRADAWLDTMGITDAVISKGVLSAVGMAPPPRLPRARGMVAVRAELRRSRSVLADLRQEGSAKARFPRGEGPMLDAALLNTAGGITGGDRFAWHAAAAPGAWLGLTTQAAERAYRARPGETGRVTVALELGPGARLDWLPQETILFDRSALERRLDADLGGDARLLVVEPVVFGRAAIGERITAIRFLDCWRIRRDGRLVHAEATRINGSADLLARPALLGGSGAMASVLLAGEDAGALLAPVRRLLVGEAGASLVRPGVLTVRILAPDGWELRRRLTPVLETLRQAPLPSMWRT